MGSIACRLLGCLEESPDLHATLKICRVMETRTFRVQKMLFLCVAVLLAMLPLATRAAGLVEVSRVRVTLEQTPMEAMPAGGIASFFRLIRLRTVGLVSPRPGTRFRVTAVAYSSTVDQTDLTPCVTASGTRVRSGIIATNFLPIGTRLRVGETVYVVEDRMNARYNGVPIIDIWHPTTAQAREFGARIVEIEILGPARSDTFLTSPMTPSPSPLQREPPAREPGDRSPTADAPGFLDDVLYGLKDLGTQIRSLLAVRLTIALEEDCLSGP